jgi:uncharacterized protein (DUF2384 family)
MRVYDRWFESERNGLSSNCWLASKVFGDEQLALKWLQKPLRRFQDRTPMEMLGTESGALRVEELLRQIMGCLLEQRRAKSGNYYALIADV